MTVTVYCPHCKKELHATPELFGKLVACPSCQQKFAIASDGNGGATNVRSSMEFTAGPNTDAYPPSDKSTRVKANSASIFDAPATTETSPSPAPSPPATLSSLEHRALSGGGGHAKFVSAPPVKAPPVAASPTTAQHTNAPPAAAAPTKPPQEKPNKTASTLQHPSSRQAIAARFVADKAAQSRINLGADGRLPELVVREGKEAKEPEEKSKSYSPVLLAVVICVSVGISMLVLFLPSGGSGSSPSGENKQEARAKIEMHYIGKQAPVEEYQQLLRRALQAHNQGNDEEERRLYRQVLRMLRADSQTGSRGLTAPKFVNENLPPNDKDLEKQLSILLRDD